jgi:murein DD-endopeptidase MepM/ murein hydrolase activator NlpD
VQLSVRDGDNAFDLARRGGVDARRFSNYLRHADAANQHALAAMRSGDTLQLCIDAAARGRALVSASVQPRATDAPISAPAGRDASLPAQNPFAAVTAQVVGPSHSVAPVPFLPGPAPASNVNPFAAVTAQVIGLAQRTAPATIGSGIVHASTDAPRFSAVTAAVVSSAGLPSPSVRTAACRAEHLTVRPGDNAFTLLQRSGIDARSLANWLRHADPASRQALRRVHGGDAVVLCVSADPHAQLASVTVQTRAVPAATTAIAAGDIPLRTSVYAAGTRLQRTMEQRLANRALALAVVSYIRNRWHLPDRLPKGSALTLAQRADDRSLVYVEFNRDDTRERAYHYVDDDGHHFVLGDQGRGVRLLAFAPPIREARVSSGWGWRTQPVLGGPEFHHGIDYAAPQGTPVYAAMDGVVEMTTWHGNYGRLIELKHADGMLTRYGHLSAYAKNLKVGVHVHRGEMIGYVGHSGLSTGSHLYFEIWEAGQRVDPARPALTVDTQLSNASRRQFLAYIQHLST